VNDLLLTHTSQEYLKERMTALSERFDQEVKNNR
jgi:ribonuclease BN (tRNA processing enzyme)